MHVVRWDFDMLDLGIFQPFAIALGLGLLVGLQREWQGADVAGIRTFPLITLMGTLAGTLDGSQVSWISASALFGLAILLVMANWARIQKGEGGAGLTTEAAALLMFLVGVSLAVGITGPAIVIAGVTAVLLQWKRRLHGLVERIGENDLKSLIHLVLIALVILPLLPDTTFGPYDVLNPYKIWLMVVLIVGISMAAYVAEKILGAQSGAVVGGIFGGMISSTATTVSYARHAKKDADLAPLAALVIVIATAVVNIRILIEVAIISPTLLRLAAPPLLLLMLLMAIEAAILFFLVRKNVHETSSHSSPAHLKAAIVFGILYAVILFVVAWAKDQFGEQALYAVAAISGLTDMDAITLSTAKLFNDGRVEGAVVWRVILVATVSNLVFKAAAVWFLGTKKLFVYVALAFGMMIVGCGLLFWLWPDLPIDIPESFVPSPPEK